MDAELHSREQLGSPIKMFALYCMVTLVGSRYSLIAVFILVWCSPNFTEELLSQLMVLPNQLRRRKGPHLIVLSLVLSPGRHFLPVLPSLSYLSQNHLYSGWW